MNMSASLRIALRALRVNKMRSGLTMLGIIIGVAAVITMIAVGDGAQTRIAEQIRSLGANLLVIRSGSSTDRGVHRGLGSKPTLTMEDAAAIGSEVPAVAVTAPTIYKTVQVVQGNRNWGTTVQGITPEYLIAREWDVTRGRSITEDDVSGAAKVALVGETVADKLLDGASSLGATLRVRNTPLTVIGILAHKGQNTTGGDQDDVIMIPISTAKIRVLGSSRANTRSVRFILAKAYSEETMVEAEEQIRALLRQRHHLRPEQADDFQVRNLVQLMEIRQESTRTLTLLLATVASVALIVGGISIMNIMLVSVIERTREIGLRLAVGARRSDVRNQFLIEAVTLSLIGGAIGVTLGTIATAAIAELAGWPILLRAETILLAFGFAGAVGIFFGIYPARKAASLNPIEALRFE